MTDSEQFVCFHCKANEHETCVGVPCQCPCPPSLPEQEPTLADMVGKFEYVKAKLSVLIPSQIKALRIRANMSQPELAEAAGLHQSRISTFELSGAANFTIKTLARLAAAFKAGLIVKFVSLPEMLEWENAYQPDTFSVAPSLPSPSDRERREEVALQIKNILLNSNKQRVVLLGNDKNAEDCHRVADWHLEIVAGWQKRIIELESARGEALLDRSKQPCICGDGEDVTYRYDCLRHGKAAFEHIKLVFEGGVVEAAAIHPSLLDLLREENERANQAESRLAEERDAALKAYDAEVARNIAWEKSRMAETEQLRLKLLAAESQVAVLRAALKDIYDFFMAPSACGDFTCYCGNPEVCGICEIRGQTEKLLALTPSPESTEEKK